MLGLADIRRQRCRLGCRASRVLHQAIGRVEKQMGERAGSRKSRNVQACMEGARGIFDANSAADLAKAILASLRRVPKSRLVSTVVS